MNSAERRPVHVPVMPREVLHALQLASGLTVLDGTVGAGGHSALIAQRIAPHGHLIAMDRDPMMLAFAKDRLQSDAPADVVCHFVCGSYVTAESALQELGIAGVDRVLLDLGLSSDQLADADRGFGFDAGGPLDMRFDVREGRSAAELLQTLDERELTELLEAYGEEPAARRIAAEIVQRRQTGRPVSTTEDLEDCVRQATGSARAAGGRHPATRVFQALRIAANQELQHVEHMLTTVLPRILNPGGIAVVLTFHSLEDRIVKTAFKGLQGWQVLTKTPIEATPAEIRLNPRSRSTKLRAVKKA